MNINRNLVHTATWWAVAKDGFGGDVYTAPVVVACRWEDRQEIFRGPTDSRELISQAVVFVDRDVKVGDYLCKDDQSLTADPSTLPKAFKVQRYDKLTDLRNVDVLRRATL